MTSFHGGDRPRPLRMTGSSESLTLALPNTDVCDAFGAKMCGREKLKKGFCNFEAKLNLL